MLKAPATKQLLAGVPKPKDPTATSPPWCTPSQLPRTATKGLRRRSRPPRCSNRGGGEHGRAVQRHCQKRVAAALQGEGKLSCGSMFKHGSCENTCMRLTLRSTHLTQILRTNIH